MSSAKIEASGLPEDDNPTGHGGPRRKIRAGHGSGLGQPPIHPGPTYPGPTYPGPTYPGPTYPGPTYPGPTYPGPIYPGPIYPSPRNNSQYNEQGEDNNILRIAGDEDGRKDGSRNYGPSEEEILRVPSARESFAACEEVPVLGLPPFGVGCLFAGGDAGAGSDVPAGVPSFGLEGAPGNGTPAVTLNVPENFSPLPSLITNIYSPGGTLTSHCLLNALRSSALSITVSSFVCLLRTLKMAAIAGAAPDNDQVILAIAFVKRFPVGVLTITSVFRMIFVKNYVLREEKRRL
ncbi:1683_t:CDS:2 [Racocetra fulgida]|uniref:1683_t:CDS:1 n=1 Tax=Racocetra fulgida TaxID=60492 RepID=A0A9N8Z439_9GLOM|nr:1683_t:CDS:2 [Racocetra fulgida]